MMTDVTKAINAQLEILHLEEKIKKLKEIIQDNVTIAQINSPEWVEVSIDKVEAGFEVESRVGALSGL